ncbi:MAG: hypothetical protein ACIARR_02195 [Phycisphaerales bacterium JB059]
MTAIECINLLPREVRARRTRTIALRAWIVALCLLVGVIVAGGIAVRAPAAIKQAQLQRSAGSLRGQITHLEKEIETSKAELERVRHKLQMIRTLEDRPDWGVLLAFIDQRRGDQVALTRFEVSWGADGLLKVMLVGQTPIPGSETALIEALDRSGLFTRTSLLGTRRETFEGADRIVFEVACEFNPTLAEVPTP